MYNINTFILILTLIGWQTLNVYSKINIIAGLKNKQMKAPCLERRF